jgi:hypothetical protein
MSDTQFTPYTEKQLYDALITKKRELVSTEGLKWTAESPTDAGVALLRVGAHLGGLLSEYIENRSKQNYIIYAEDDLAVHATTRSLGYKIRGDIPSRILVKVTTSGSQTIPTGTKLYKELSDGTEIPFETQSELVFSGAESKQVYAVQGETFSTTTTGDGTEYQTVTINDYPIAYGSVAVIVGNTLWSEVSDFVNSDSDSEHYMVEYDFNGQPTVWFGDGEFGATPSSGALITVAWRTCDGSVGNLAPGEMRFERSFSKVTSVENQAPATGVLLYDVTSGDTEVYLEDDGSISSFADTGVAYIDEDSFSYTGITDNYFTGVTGLENSHAAGDEVTYTTGYTYGADRESNKQAKVSAIRYNRTKTSCNSILDYQYYSSQVPGVARAKAYNNYNIIVIQVIPADGGIPSSSLLDDVYDYILPRKNAVHTITVANPNYVYIDVVAEISPASGQQFSDVVKPAVEDKIQEFLNPLTRTENDLYYLNGWGNILKKNKLEAEIFDIENGMYVADVELTTFKRSAAESGAENINLNPTEVAHVGSIHVIMKDISTQIPPGSGEGTSQVITTPVTNVEVQ